MWNEALLVPGSALKPYEAEAFLMLSDKDPDGNIDIQLFLEETSVLLHVVARLSQRYPHPCILQYEVLGV